jgi:SAM-dependent methyltransferase
MAELEVRVAREKANYDEGTVHDESGKLQARFLHVFRCPNSSRADQYCEQLVARYGKDRDMLDYGCFDGWMIPSYLKIGARSITGLDISEAGIERARLLYGSDTTKFYTGDAHNLPFRDSSFDLIVGQGILHHLDLNLALREVQRVLRPGGHAIFREPLGDNPGAKLLRALTPKARTVDEKPLTRKSIHYADSLFAGSSHLFFNLTSVPVAMITSLTSLGKDNLALRVTDSLDRLLVRTPLKYWMRAVVLVWHKPQS